MDALDDVLAPMARLLHKVIRAPDAVCAQSALATGNLAVQAHGNILIDGRLLPLSEFFISVGESGVRKSAADQAALAPVIKRQRLLFQGYEEAKAQLQVEEA